jgi:choline dehydrogenase
VSAYDAWIDPIRDDPARDLQIICGAQVERVLFADEGDEASPPTAIGVAARLPGSTDLVELLADDVILCAGAVHSPAILQRSGLGPPGLLAGLGITLRAALPVGENFQDHPGIRCANRRLPSLYHVMARPNSCSSSSRHTQTRQHSLCTGRPRLSLTQEGAGSSAHSIPRLTIPLAPHAQMPDGGRRHTGVVGRYTSGVPGTGLADMQILSLNLGSVPHDAPNGSASAPKVRAGFGSGGVAVWVNQAFSTGTCRIASSNPADEPTIEENMLSDRRDVSRLRLAAGVLLQLAATPPIQAIVAEGEHCGLAATQGTQVPPIRYIGGQGAWQLMVRWHIYAIGCRGGCRRLLYI